MQRIIEGWTAYQEWASNLHGEGRFYIIAGTLLLLSMYVLIDSRPANTSDVSQKTVTTKKMRGMTSRTATSSSDFHPPPSHPQRDGARWRPDMRASKVGGGTVQKIDLNQWPRFKAP
jgi:hypothetical protein